MRTTLIVFATLFLPLATGPVYAEPQEKVVVGYLEKVQVGKKSLTMKAKIDSGADNSSINATGIKVYKKSGQEWARFKVTNFNGKSVTINRPIVRYARIKKKDGGRQRRPVIELKICLAGIEKIAQVNLVDRSHFKYQVLMGRSYLRPEFLIDSSKSFTVEPKCR